MENPSFPFLSLPAPIRQRIYTLLLHPPPPLEVEDADFVPTTTINYTLLFPHLQHPSDTTFSSHQLDICSCPVGSRSPDVPTIPASPTSPDASFWEIEALKKMPLPQYHVYTRHICTLPVVSIHTCHNSTEPSLWLLQTPGRNFNILRPASSSEAAYNRPGISILQTCRLIYTEALPFLYQNRNFHLLTSVCSRGRYQAHATQKFLESLSPLARKNITGLTLLCQSTEEDCKNGGSTDRAYIQLASALNAWCPRLQDVWLRVWDRGLVGIEPWVILFRISTENNVKVYVTEREGRDEIIGEGKQEGMDGVGGEADEALAFSEEGTFLWYALTEEEGDEETFGENCRGLMDLWQSVVGHSCSFEEGKILEAVGAVRRGAPLSPPWEA